MKFVSINSVLAEMVKRKHGTDYQPVKQPDENQLDDRYADNSYTEVTAYSEAASELHQAIHNTNTENALRWVAIDDETQKPLFNESVAGEGMGILRHASGWLRRFTAEHVRYLHDLDSAQRAGLDIATIRPRIKPNDGLYTLKALISRSHEIGFNRAELDTFMGWCDGDDNVTLPDAASAPQKIIRQKLQVRTHLLAAEIGTAKERALNSEDANSVWAELVKMAEKQEGLLIGYSSDGLQYKGKVYQDSEVPDVLTKRALQARMRRHKSR